MKNQKLILEEKNINKVILKLSWPMVIAFLLHTSFNIVDGIFVGKISAEALAAVSISFPVIFLMIALISGVGTGATSLIARSIGAKYYNKANNVAMHAIILSILFSILFTAAGLLFGKHIFSLITDDQGLLPLVLEYINIIFIGSVFMFLTFTANHILRGEGNMKTPMYVLGGSAVLNIILDPIFIFTFGLGIKGAAIATVVSRMVSCIIAFIYILGGNSFVKVSIGYFRYSFKIIREIFEVGIPTSISQIIGSISFFLLTMIIAGFGAEAIAAFGIIFRVEGLLFMPVLGVMNAIITIVGQNYGAGKINRARESTFNASLITAIFGIFIGLIFLIFSKHFALLFNNNLEVLRMTVSYFNINFWVYPFFAVMFMIVGSFLGVGKALPPLIINFLRLLVLLVPLAYYFSLAYGLIGVWIAIAISGFVSSIVSIVWYKLVGFRK